ncbi:MAG: hypothetical protein JWR76_2020 [Mucilaginibacter sp.]|nr:hypothetical protein [Mucilaginibacter sp.]
MNLYRLLSGYPHSKTNSHLQIEIYENNVLFLQQRFQIDKPVVFINNNFVPIIITTT